MKDRELFEKLLKEVELPDFFLMETRQEQPQLTDIKAALAAELEHCAAMQKIKKNATVAIAMGSREINGLADIAETLISILKEKGAVPFIVPAMGSHGGATAQGQKDVLYHLGITEERLGVRIASSMETEEIGISNQGFPVFMDSLAFHADHIIPIARIKAHTEFRGPYESGILKMLVIGLGKQYGASICHKLGFPNMSRNLQDFGKVILKNAPVLMGLGIIESAEREWIRI